jgi:hypothetical protein
MVVILAITKLTQKHNTTARCSKIYPLLPKNGIKKKEKKKKLFRKTTVAKNERKKN